ncbi:MAG: ComF family protein [Mangrovibacterium sp.]
MKYYLSGKIQPMIFDFKTHLNNFLDLLIPRGCLCCHRKLLVEEKYLCIGCMSRLPISNDWEIPQNNLKDTLEELIPVESAAALLAYESASKYHHILHALKYHNQPQVGIFFGNMFGRLITQHKILADADYICPIPLHPKKEKKRGYNQSAYLAKGVAEYTSVAFNDSNLIRRVNTQTQTKMDFEERQENMKGVFHCVNPQLFQDKHIILIDDVITTGATIKSCTYTILPQCNARISVLCLSRIL